MHTVRTPARALLAALAALALGAPTAGAQARENVYWADWTSSSLGESRVGSVAGSLNVNGTAVGVTFSGELEFATTAPGGTNYFAPRATFLGTLLQDAQPITSDIIAISGGTGIVNTFTFAQAITNPVMSIVSLGRGSTPVDYVFNAPFELVSGGPNSTFGGVALTRPSPNTVRGQEGNGTIRFLGTFTSLSFTTVGGEYWNGFTLGVQGLASNNPPPVNVIPEPSTYALMAAGLALTGALARRRTRTA
jgi:hypothetical protein